MNTPLETQSERSTSNIWISGLIGWALAFVGVSTLFGITRLLDIPLQVGGGPPDWTTLIPLMVAGLIPPTLVPAIVATVLYALLRLFSKQRASRIFQVVAVVALLISFGGPFSLTVSTVNKITLALMHLVTATAIVWALTVRK